MTALASEPRFSSPSAALDALLEHLSPLQSEPVALCNAAGRVLAQAALADRDHPSCDVSAMDGYAVRLAEISRGSLPVAGQVRVGQAPPQLPPGAALHIVTGAPVPSGTDAIVRVEDIDRRADMITLRIPASNLRPDQDIRRQGENIRRGQEVIRPGTAISPAALGTLSTFGIREPIVYRKVRVGILTTGDEVIGDDIDPHPWQIRNTNASSLGGLFSAVAWAQVVCVRHAPDELVNIRNELAGLLEQCDLVLLTGGVSMGDRDHVPAAITECGCRQVFHKLPIRPGKPILAAVGPQGQAVLGLPGNPVSVLTTAVRFAGSAARRLAGFAASPSPVYVPIRHPDAATTRLWWSRPVRLTGTGDAELVDSRGSGDIASAARSDGFVELPPGGSGPGPWPFYHWEL